jgi:serine protease
MSKSVRRSLAAALALALSAPAFAGQVHTAGLTESGRFDRFIVKFANGTPEAKDASARQHALDGLGNAEGVGLAHQLRLAVGADVVRSSKRLDRARAERLMRRLASHPDVEYVEVDKLNKPFGTPNDTSYSQQWGYFSATAGIRADQAWDLGNGAGAVVAVLDTGITSHSDLNANVVAGYDFIKDVTISNDGNGRDADAHDPGDWAPAGACDAGSPAENSSWHGTHVAGTVAAVTNNAKGVAGTAGGAKIMPLRVLGRCGGYTSDIADAIVWASGGSVAGLPANPNPAEVISLSLGGSGACSSTEQAAINSAVNRGTTVVVAAGNENANVSTSSPANCANVIAVGAITSTGQRASFSNYGRRRRRRRARLQHPVDHQQGHAGPGPGRLRLVQRHFDGDAARGRRGRADAGLRHDAKDARADRVAPQEQRARLPGRGLATDRRRHRRRARGDARRPRQHQHAAARECRAGGELQRRDQRPDRELHRPLHRQRRQHRLALVDLRRRQQLDHCQP